MSKDFLRYPFGLDNLPDILLQLRSHSQSKSKREYQPALKATHSIQLEAWNSLLLSSCSPSHREIDEELLTLILAPQECILNNSARIYQAIEMIDELYDIFVKEMLSRYFQVQNGENGNSVIDAEKQKILQQCLHEMKQRYIYQLISLTLTQQNCPDFQLPPKYQEQFHQLQSNQLKLSIFNFLS
jgi:ribosomal protein L28